MAFTPVELTKDGKTRIAESPAAEAMLRFDGWLPTGTPQVVPVFDDKVRDLIGKKGSATELALREAFVPVADTAPDPAISPAYLDTSTVPPTLQVWNGATFVLASGSGGGGGGAAPSNVPTLAESGTGWNIPAGSLDNYRMAKTAAKSGGLLEMVFVGDSTFAGQTNVYNQDAVASYSPVTRLRELFASQALLPDGGHGHVNGTLDYPVVSGEPSDAGITAIGFAMAPISPSYRMVNGMLSSTAGQSVDYVVYGSHLRIYYLKGYEEGRFSYSIDGAAAVTVDAHNPAYAARIGLVDLPGLAAGKHTVRIVNIGGGVWPSPADWQNAFTGQTGTLPVGTYYYVTTGATVNGETTPNPPVPATLTGSPQGVQLVTRNTGYNPGKYNVYRSTSPSGPFHRIGTDIAAQGNGQLVWTDDGSATPNATLTPPTTSAINPDAKVVQVDVDAQKSSGTVLHNFGLRLMVSSDLNDQRMQTILGLNYSSSIAASASTKDNTPGVRRPALGVFNFGLNDQGVGVLDATSATTKAATLKARAKMWCKACRAADADPVILIPPLEAWANSTYAPQFIAALTEAATEENAAWFRLTDAAIGPAAGWPAAGYGASDDVHLSVAGYKKVATELMTKVLVK